MHGGQHSRVYLPNSCNCLRHSFLGIEKMVRGGRRGKKLSLFLSFSCSFLLELKKEAGFCQNYVPTNTRNCNTGMIIAKEKKNLHPHPWGKHTRQRNTKQLPTRIPPPCHIPTQSYFPQPAQGEPEKLSLSSAERRKSMGEKIKIHTINKTKMPA